MRDVSEKRASIKFKMESTVDLDLLEQLGEIISNLTTSGDPSLDAEKLKKLKAICKKADVYLKHVYHLVLTQLKKNHAEVRLSSLQIISELFLRSHMFRELLLTDFQLFLELTVETDHKQPLPPPKSAAKTLKEKALQAVESWYHKFGPHYKKLDLGYSYLKRVKKVEFNAVTARTEVERRQSEERARRRNVLISGQIIQVEQEMSEMISEMELCATEIENCFKLLLPHPDDYDLQCGDETGHDTCELEKVGCKSDDATKRSAADKVHSSDNKNLQPDGSTSPMLVDQVETELGRSEVNEQLLSNHGLGTRSYLLSIKVDTSGPKVKETIDNSILLKTVQEMHKEMTHKHLPMINKWLSVLSKGEGTQQKIEHLIDLKRTLEAASDKFHELKITPMTDTRRERKDDDEDDTDDFVEVPEKEGLELIIPLDKRAEYGLEPLSPTEQNSKEIDKQTDFLKQFGADPRDIGDPTSRATALYNVKDHLPVPSGSSATMGTTTEVADERKKSLFEKAPVVPFDMDLYFWDDPAANTHRMVKMYLDNNWASKEHEGEYIIGSEREARPTRMITFSGSFQPVKWSCRAPLPSGKLCPRRDRVKCPFHGKIIPRDETGAPVNNFDITSSSERRSACTDTKLNTDSTATASWKEIGEEIEAATGLDLGNQNKQKRKSQPSGKNESKRCGLTDVKKANNTAKTRLEKIVLNKKAMKRVANEMDAIATKRCLDKFANQFNYSLH